MKVKRPRALLLDIETAPIRGYVWQLWDNDVALNQIESDWHVLSWAAKWLDDPPNAVMYHDQRLAKNIQNDRPLLQKLWPLLNEADILITHNGKAFDQKKINARFAVHGFPPPSALKHIDTKIIASKHFSFTSNKLEYLAEKLCKKHRKSKHQRFTGFELWRECLLGNALAWREMEKYNRKDVLVLEELYHRLVSWDDTINFSLYHDDPVHVCRCGSVDLEKRGYHFTSAGKFQRYCCRKCGAWTRDRINQFSKEKRQSLHLGVPR